MILKPAIANLPIGVGIAADFAGLFILFHRNAVQLLLVIRVAEPSVRQIEQAVFLPHLVPRLLTLDVKPFLVQVQCVMHKLSEFGRLEHLDIVPPIIRDINMSSGVERDAGTVQEQPSAGIAVIGRAGDK